MKPSYFNDNYYSYYKIRIYNLILFEKLRFIILESESLIKLDTPALYLHLQINFE